MKSTKGTRRLRLVSLGEDSLVLEATNSLVGFYGKVVFTVSYLMFDYMENGSPVYQSCNSEEFLDRCAAEAAFEQRGKHADPSQLSGRTDAINAQTYASTVQFLEGVGRQHGPGPLVDPDNPGDDGWGREISIRNYFDLMHNGEPRNDDEPAMVAMNMVAMLANAADVIARLQAELNEQKSGGTS